MKGLCLLLAIVVCASAFSTVDQEWEAFKTKYNKHYSGRDEELHHRTFKENIRKIAEHNKDFHLGKVSFKLGLNKFTDMLPEEMAYLRGYKSPEVQPRRALFKAAVGDSYPDTVDWRDNGYVTAVKDQGQCGSCWSFSATGSLEGQHFKATGELVSLSEQNLVDCVKTSFGCNGGSMVSAFHYISTNDGDDTEASYPYEAKNGECRFDPAYVGATCTGSVTLAQSEEALKAAVATVGPISVAIDASNFSFQLYSSGIYYESKCSSTSLDHGVLAVGYGTENGQDYWLVKNSWGLSWGDEGYIKMARNRDNNCGIATDASYPVV